MRALINECDGDRTARDDRVVREPYAGEPVVLYDHAGHHTVDDPDSPRGQQPASSAVGLGCTVPEEHDVRAQLGEEQRLVDRHRPAGEHGDRPVAHLPAVAVGAVHDVASPPLRQPRYVGQLVHQPGGHQQPACPHRPAVGEGEAEAAFLRGQR